MAGEFVEINGAWFRTDVSITKKDFFEKYKNKFKHPFDCEETYKELIKFIPKVEKQEKEK